MQNNFSIADGTRMFSLEIKMPTANSSSDNKFFTPSDVIYRLTGLYITVSDSSGLIDLQKEGADKFSFTMKRDDDSTGLWIFGDSGVNVNSINQLNANNRWFGRLLEENTQYKCIVSHKGALSTVPFVANIDFLVDTYIKD